ncbi:MAG: sugar phosphate isomerase/epimerase family protein [Mucilaginibacter sp.]
MKLLFFCTRWGHEHIPWSDFCKKVKDAGYNGIETTLPMDEGELAAVLGELKKHDLNLIAVQWDTGTADFNAHIKEYELRLRSAATANPLFITSHTGKDFFSFDQNRQLLELAKSISAETNVKIIHETHRGKFSFAAHITQGYLQKLPWLRLTLDVSHWFTVAESDLTNQPAAVDLALHHTDHIHARIGHAQGPQVTDPRSPEWQQIVERHLSLWDQVLSVRREEGADQFTFTTEFGPYPYMQLQPFTNTPIAGQWEINEYMLNLLKNRYKDIQK